MDRQERVVVEAVDPPVGLSGGTDHAAQVLLDDRNVVHDLSETVFPFFCQASSHERPQMARGNQCQTPIAVEWTRHGRMRGL